MKKFAVIIPALNEADSIGQVIDGIPTPYRNSIFVGDNGSSDDTVKIAQSKGATVTHASRRGYGSACLAALDEAKNHQPDVYIFLDADYSDYPEDMEKIVSYLVENHLDLVIGSRNLGEAEKGALLPQARFGNWLATTLLWLRFGYRFTDLGPFRAIRAEALERLKMSDPNFGWTMEMQAKALKYGLKVGEVSVRYRTRIGVSKITGTFFGTLSAGYKILWTLARYSF